MMKMYQKAALSLGAGLVISALTLPAQAGAVPSVTVNAGFTAYDTANFTATYTSAGDKITTDRLKKLQHVGMIETTQPAYARYRDIKFDDSTAKSGVLTFTNADGKQAIEVTVAMPLIAPTVNGKEGSSEAINKTSAQWPLLAASEYNQIPAGEYTDTITVSYDTL